MGQPILVLVLYMDGITLLKNHFWASGLNMLLNYRMATPNTSGQPGWVILLGLFHRMPKPILSIGIRPPVCRGLLSRKMGQPPLPIADHTLRRPTDGQRPKVGTSGDRF